MTTLCINSHGGIIRVCMGLAPKCCWNQQDIWNTLTLCSGNLKETCWRWVHFRTVFYSKEMINLKQARETRARRWRRLALSMRLSCVIWQASDRQKIYTDTIRNLWSVTPIFLSVIKDCILVVVFLFFCGWRHKGILEGWFNPRHRCSSKFYLVLGIVVYIKHFPWWTESSWYRPLQSTADVGDQLSYYITAGPSSSWSSREIIVIAKL